MADTLVKQDSANELYRIERHTAAGWEATSATYETLDAAEDDLRKWRETEGSKCRIVSYRRVEGA